MSKHPLAHFLPARAATLLIALSTLFFAGCSTTRVIDSEVIAFETWKAAPPAPGTTYRFERLPSQQAQAARQDAVEAATRPALARVGLLPSAAAPRYNVQVLLNTQVVEQVFADPFGEARFSGYPGYGYGYGPRPGYGRFGGYGSFGLGGFRGASFGGFYSTGGFDTVTFRHEVSVIMRDNSTQQVAFETRALHDGPWNDTLVLLPALLDAALQGFPQPPPGIRRINVPLAPTSR